MADYGYEECAPSLAADVSEATTVVEDSSSSSKRGRIFRRGSLFGGAASKSTRSKGSYNVGSKRRSSLFHVGTNVSSQGKTGDNDSGDGLVKGSTSVRKSKDGKKKRSKRRGTAAHVRAPSNAAVKNKNDDVKKSSNRRKSLFHTSNVVEEEPLSRQQKKEERKSRRSSLFHLGRRTPSSNNSNAVSKSSSASKKKKKSAKKNKKPSPTQEIMKNIEEMENLVKAIHRDPQSRKVMQERMQKEYQGGFCSAA